MKTQQQPIFVEGMRYKYNNYCGESKIAPEEAFFFLKSPYARYMYTVRVHFQRFMKFPISEPSICLN